MKKLFVAVIVLASTSLHCSLTEKIARNQDAINSVKAQVQAGQLADNYSKCSGHTGGCSVLH